jgi:hypothetical protein
LEFAEAVRNQQPVGGPRGRVAVALQGNLARNIQRGPREAAHFAVDVCAAVMFPVRGVGVALEASVGRGYERVDAHAAAEVAFPQNNFEHRLHLVG